MIKFKKRFKTHVLNLNKDLKFICVFVLRWELENQLISEIVHVHERQM